MFFKRKIPSSYILPKTALISGDIFRANPNFEFNQWLNVKWIAALLQESLKDIFATTRTHETEFAGHSYSDFYTRLYQTQGEDVYKKLAQV